MKSGRPPRNPTSFPWSLISTPREGLSSPVHTDAMAYPVVLRMANGRRRISRGYPIARALTASHKSPSRSEESRPPSPPCKKVCPESCSPVYPSPDTAYRPLQRSSRLLATPLRNRDEENRRERHHNAQVERSREAFHQPRRRFGTRVVLDQQRNPVYPDHSVRSIRRILRLRLPGLHSR